MEQTLKTLNLNFFGSGKHKTSPESFFKLDNAILLDVRSRQEVESLSLGLAHHHNVQCINIPLDELPENLDKIPKRSSVALFCPQAVRSAIGFSYLLSKGFSDVRILSGGYEAIAKEVLPGKVLKQMKINL